MKNLFLIFSLLTFSFSFAQTHDFGEVARNGGDLVHRFELVNEGDEPLTILRVKTSCTCIKTSFDRKPIASGGTGFVEVRYRVGKKPAGVFYKVVDVYTSAGRRSYIIKGNAIAATEPQRAGLRGK